MEQPKECKGLNLKKIRTSSNTKDFPRVSLIFRIKITSNLELITISLSKLKVSQKFMEMVLPQSTIIHSVSSKVKSLVF